MVSPPSTPSPGWRPGAAGWQWCRRSATAFRATNKRRGWACRSRARGRKGQAALDRDQNGDLHHARGDENGPRRRGSAPHALMFGPRVSGPEANAELRRLGEQSFRMLVEATAACLGSGLVGVENRLEARFRDGRLTYVVKTSPVAEVLAHFDTPGDDAGACREAAHHAQRHSPASPLTAGERLAVPGQSQRPAAC